MKLMLIVVMIVMTMMILTMMILTMMVLTMTILTMMILTMEPKITRRSVPSSPGRSFFLAIHEKKDLCGGDGYFGEKKNGGKFGPKMA